MTLTGEYAPGTWEWVRKQVETYEGSGGTKGTTVEGKPVVVVTSVGAKSGKLRKHPVIRVEHDGSYAMVASKGGDPSHPAWYHNLKANPRVQLQDGTEKGVFVAREVTGDERAAWWERAIEVWPHYVDYTKKTSREIPVFVLEPES
ncbi:nitroreductase family deazaflavin-dependent oxidoreductase [Herbihabitans rhizosphaerae]|nr:nitroreductase family deazaflavin-dependent oxidoreductase [Herbihabitans rhizosphaerae]